jgi:hypothetical protein
MKRLIIRGTVAVAVLAAAWWLWSWSDDEEHGRGLGGGPLFDAGPRDVASVEIRRPSGATVITRHGDGWRATGLVEDFVDSDRFEPALRAILDGVGQPVIAGTEPDERRYGFGGDGSLELVFNLTGGGRRRLALGDANPATGVVYASGAGRIGVFGVGGGLYAEASRLPDSARLARLLPPVALADLDSLVLGRRGGDALVFAPLDDGRWWMRLDGDHARPGGRAARYHDRYADRRRAHDGAAWALADARRLRDLVFRASDTAVAGFLPPGADAGAESADRGLVPPYRTVAMHRGGADPWLVAFGEVQERQPGVRVLAARRQQALVMTRPEAVAPCEGAVSDFLDLGALSFTVALVDSLRLDTPDRPVLWGRRVMDDHTARERKQSPWAAITPPGWELVFGAEATADHVADMRMRLDRLACVDVLAPSASDPLVSDERWRLRAWSTTGEAYEVWIGRLAGSGEAAVWDPADGRLLGIDSGFLVTLRNLRHDLARP